MSRVGCPYDNAMAESFMKTLKQEEVDGRSYRDLAQARQAIEHFLESLQSPAPAFGAGLHAPADRGNHPAVERN